ncbi:aldolase/citrate lyase family protein [Ihubacter sp. rT4E-8]|uniref:aldolase/citrate lyase family protein n=1 Tax=Ihubacter sp. rT4E-8 TaxID=3242369 RepID=UPI003CF074AF
MESIISEWTGRAGFEKPQDCQVTVTLREEGGRNILLHSKQERMFGNAIRQCAENCLDELSAAHVTVEIVDYGCLDFGIAARIKTAYARAVKEKQNTADFEQSVISASDRMTEGRMRTMLFCPASQPKMLLNAPVYRPDAILFDLEDAVTLAEKDSARDLLCEAMKRLPFGGCQIFTRINGLRTRFGEEDVRAIVPAGIRRIRLAMCESPEDVRALDQLLCEVEKQHGIAAGSVKIQCSIETAKGVLHARESVRASDRVISLSFGAEDYTRSMGTSRSKEGTELTFARQYLPVIAAEAGISAIDTVFADLEDTEGFIAEVKHAKSLGFTGKSCIHPSQIPMVHDIYTPSQKELEDARKVLHAMREAEAAGIGVVAVDGKMVDEPVVSKAKYVLQMLGEEV